MRMLSHHSHLQSKHVNKQMIGPDRFATGYDSHLARENTECGTFAWRLLGLRHRYPVGHGIDSWLAEFFAVFFINAVVDP